MKRQIETARLLLAPATIDDFDACMRYWSEPSIPWPHGVTPDREHGWVRFLKNHGHWQLFGFGPWLIWETRTSTLIGEVGFMNTQRETCPARGDEPEFGLVLLPSAQRQGFGQEAALAAHGWCDAMLPGQDTIGVLAATNTRALRLTGRLGYRADGQGSYHGDEVVFLRRRSRYFDSSAWLRAITV
ncbi:MAG TPA: GNAT family N-acetyltransferase [Paraburkholderia sp.]|jgi:RimJ/RimL family protein N-acetyltransferase|nr:GNAT family N-acetyltransferase [Paraburkholderia sp.]